MLHHALWRCRTCRKLLLLIVSLYFFAYWDVRFIPLLIGYVLIGWLTGVFLSIVLNEKYKRILLTCSITFFLAFLGIFKYANFFLDSLHPINECIGWKIGTLKWTLPLGISFFTFQSISYVVDVSRKQVKECLTIFKDFFKNKSNFEKINKLFQIIFRIDLIFFKSKFNYISN